MKKVILKNGARLVWFRNDLRLTDNETLRAAVDDGTGPVAYVYIYDEANDLLTPEGHPRIGEWRKNYLAQSVRDLKSRLRERGADLIGLSGDPLVILPMICERLNIKQVFYSRLTAFEERKIEAAVEQALAGMGVDVRTYQTHTLLCDEDAKDFDLYQPMSFSKLRKFIEKRAWPIRAPLGEPKILPACLEFDGPVWPLESIKATGKNKSQGGESTALADMFSYIKADHLSTYKQTRNGLLEWTDSSKFSPALAVGSLSVRTLYAEVRRFEAERGANLSTLWYLYELLWRDHFHFMARVRGADLFTDRGRAQTPRLSKADEAETFRKWIEGKSGVPFVDAGMNELRLTGWLSNRMRQNVASFLVHNLGVDWRWGARWFESCLIDYDPASNWGNWAYIAGAGFDHKPHVFDIDQQAKMFDPDGVYINRWARR